jgi:hypothetical protein
MKSNLITVNEAMEVLGEYNRGPQTIPGLLYTGRRYDFVILEADNFHVRIDKKKLLFYLNVLEFCPASIARDIGVTAGSLSYTILKMGIKTKRHFNKKYIGEKDVQRIKKYYQKKAIK